jgi:serine/threonine-protein kinase
MPVELEVLRPQLASLFALEREVGRGGMAAVFRARRLADGAVVAVKVLQPEVAAALGGARFLREITFLRRLSHPHILPLLDSGEAGRLIYFVMPLATGESLRARLNRVGPLAVREVTEIGRQMALALDYAHGQNVLHRDLKPENILDHDGRWVLCDFGLARAIEVAGHDSLSPSGIAIGTPTYMSPEQGAGSEALDGRADLYGLACVLYEALAGVPPFTGATPQAVIARHAADPPPKLRVVRPDVPGHVEAAIAWGLAKRPDQRPAAGAELARLLGPAPA